MVCAMASWDGMALDATARRPLLGSQHAEFVSLGVGQHDPALRALTDVGVACAQLQQPLDFGMLVVRPEVEVDAVLHNSSVVDAQEQPVRAGSGRRGQPNVTVLVHVLWPSQRLRPPVAQCGRVGRVNTDLVELQPHVITRPRGYPDTGGVAFIETVATREIYR